MAESPDPYAKQRRRWFELFGGVAVANRRLFIALVALAAVAIAEAVALAALAPLKTAVPYVVKIEDTGRVSVEAAAAQRYVPGKNEIDYALARWVRNLLTIDSYSTSNPARNNVIEAYVMTRGRASEQFVEWFRAARPVEAVNQDPTLSRVVQVRNVLTVKEGEAVIIRVVTETRSAKQKPVTENQMVSIRYAIVPPKTEKEILENPIGLVITDFSVSKDLT